jgi:hypothetical protein
MVFLVLWSEAITAGLKKLTDDTERQNRLKLKIESVNAAFVLDFTTVEVMT